MTDHSIQHIQRVSRNYVVLFNVLLVTIPVGSVLYWIFFNHLPVGFHADLPIVPTDALSTLQRALGALVSVLPVGVALYGLLTLKGLFRLYADAVIFSSKNVRYLHRLGYTFVAWVIANTLFTPLISLVITAANREGERVLVVQFGIVELLTLIVGGIILVIAWVVNIGRDLEDEQTYTV